jgi:hypothetical protein
VKFEDATLSGCVNAPTKPLSITGSTRTATAGIAKRTLLLPPGDVYNRVVHWASGVLKDQQRDARTRLGDQLHGRAFTKEEADQIWRVQARIIWSRALFDRSTGLRDLYDYFTAYADLGRIQPSDWRVFWTDEARGDAMPATMLTALALQYQLGSPATYGNAGDISHVRAALVSDAFVTCDAAFYEVLRRVAHHGRIARFVLLDKRKSSPVDELSAALRRAHPAHGLDEVSPATIDDTGSEDE